MNTAPTSLQAAAYRQRAQIAVDGPAAGGKSTIGAGLAKCLGCSYLDTGLMYRAITWLALSAAIDLNSRERLIELAREAQFSLISPTDGLLAVKDRVLGDELRSTEVDEAVSTVAAIPEVRTALVHQQRSLARGRCIVMVGRDIGTVVLPQAIVKLWITASPEERARRRVHERSGNHTEHEQELERIAMRDLQDTRRSTSPLRQADDAIVIETDTLSRQDALQAAVAAVRSRLEALY